MLNFMEKTLVLMMVGGFYELYSPSKYDDIIIDQIYMRYQIYYIVL